MIKKVISKVGKRHRPEIDMMEFIQIDSIREFDLDKHCEVLTDEGWFEASADFKNTIKKKSIKENVKPDIEQNAEFSEEIENNEV